MTERENEIVEAQALVADMHNESQLTDFTDYHIESYFGRNIKVIFTEKFVEATVKELKNTVFEHTLLIGTLSQVGGISAFADEKKYYKQIAEKFLEKYSAKYAYGLEPSFLCQNAVPLSISCILLQNARKTELLDISVSQHG